MRSDNAPNIILASGSPRRRELLRQIGLEFEVKPALAEPSVETFIKLGLPPEQAVLKVAEAKLDSVLNTDNVNSIIIAADTIVAKDGKVFGKPKNVADAKRMLSILSGTTHQVLTGIAIFNRGERCTFTERTDVTFRPLSDLEIDEYVSTGEPLDKAGAYGIQGRAAVFVSRIEGDYFNVVGLPLCRLAAAIKSDNVSLIEKT
jgi:septum formation protein